MKKQNLLLNFILCFCILITTSNFISQGTYHIIGTDSIRNSNDDYPSIYGNWYRGVKHQMLIRASEMQASGILAGNIIGIAFDVAATSGSAMQDFEINILSTSQTSLTSWNNSGLSNHYGPVNYPDITGWNQHSFHTPFYWDGTSNIVIQTCFYNSSWSQNAKMNMSNYSYYNLIYRRNDNWSPCTSNWMNGNETLRPNIRFQWYDPNSPPITDFSTNATTSCSGTITFTDQSTNNPTSWLWDFGDGTSSTLQNPSHTYTNSGSYTVQLTCSNSFGSNNISYPNLININLSASAPIACNCTPITSNTTTGFGITEVAFNSINHISGNAIEGYSDFTCDSTLLYVGQTYQFMAVHNSPAPHNCTAWIDYNNDGVFDVNNEEIASSSNTDTTFGTVQIPSIAVLNTPLRLRVIADFSLHGALSPCTNPQDGQAEDYAVFIEINTLPPAANFTSDKTYTCDGIVQFTDLSSNAPYAWYWEFGDGSTAISQNPTHTYSSDGNYDVQLIVSNAYGTDTINYNQYIEVNTVNMVIAASCSPSTLSYCCDYGINRVQFSNINHPSLDAIEGYLDLSCDQQAIVEANTNYTLRVYTGTNNPQDTRAWIDYDNDGVFSSSEKVMEKLNDYDPVGIVQIPNNTLTNTPLRMRISSDEVGSNNGPCDDPLRGQVEDYGVIVATCPQPSNTIIGQVTNSSVELSWSPGGSENSWNLLYGPLGFGVLSGTGTAINNLFSSYFVVTGLTQSSAYDFYIQSNCTGSTSYWDGPHSATTLHLNKINKEDLIIYPNPSKGIFTLNSAFNINTYEIINILGELIESSYDLRSTTIQIDLSQEPKGIYFVKVADKLNNSIINKVIIK